MNPAPILRACSHTGACDDGLHHIPDVGVTCGKGYRAVRDMWVEQGRTNYVGFASCDGYGQAEPTSPWGDPVLRTRRDAEALRARLQSKSDEKGNPYAYHYYVRDDR